MPICCVTVQVFNIIKCLTKSWMQLLAPLYWWFYGVNSREYKQKLATGTGLCETTEGGPGSPSPGRWCHIFPGLMRQTGVLWDQKQQRSLNASIGEHCSLMVDITTPFFPTAVCTDGSVQNGTHTPLPHLNLSQMTLIDLCGSTLALTDFLSRSGVSL